METPPASRPGRKIALAALALAALAAVALGIFVVRFDANRYAPQIAAAAESATGRRVTFGGPLRLRLLPRLALRVEEMTLAGAPGDERPEMLRVGRFDAVVGLLSLLRGTPEVQRVELEDVALALEIDAAGTPNWRFTPGGPAAAPGAAPAAEPAPSPTEPAASAGAAVVPLVRELVVRNARVSWHDARSGARHEAVVSEAQVETAGPGAPTSLALAARIDDVPLEASGDVGPLSAWLRDEATPWPVSLRVTIAGGLTLEAEGSLAAPREGRGIALAVRAKAEDLQALGETTGLGAGLRGPLALSFRVSDPAPRRYAIEEIAFTSDAGDLAGRATVSLGGERPDVEAALESRRLEPSRMRVPGSAAAADVGSTPRSVDSAGSSPAAPPAPSDARLVPAAPLPWDALSRVDARVSLRAGELVAGGVPLREARVTLALADGVLTLKELRGGVAGGTLELEGALAAAGRSVSVRGSLDGADLGALLRETKPSDLVRRAPTDVRIDLSGRGATAREVAASLGGRIASITEGAAIDSRVLELLGDAASAWKPLFGQNVTEVKCAALRFDLRGGVARAVVIHADAGAVVVSGEGTLDLGRETLALVLRPHAADARYASVAAPISVDGSFARPRFTPDVVATALGAAERFGGKTLRREAGAVASLLGVGASGPALTCAQAEAIARGQAAPPAPAGSTSGAGPSPAAREATRALEKGLDKLFGR